MHGRHGRRGGVRLLVSRPRNRGVLGVVYVFVQALDNPVVRHVLVLLVLLLVPLLLALVSVERGLWRLLRVLHVPHIIPFSAPEHLVAGHVATAKHLAGHFATAARCPTVPPLQPCRVLGLRHPLALLLAPQRGCPATGGAGSTGGSRGGPRGLGSHQMVFRFSCRELVFLQTTRGNKMGLSFKQNLFFISIKYI